MRFTVIALCFVSIFILISSFNTAPDYAEVGFGDPWKIPAKYKKMENPTAPSNETNNIGKRLYKRYCASCHGKTGLGDGKKSYELDTEVPDMTTEEYKNRKAGVKYYQSFIGRDDMPNFEKKIPDEEDRWFIINYIDTL